MRDRIRWVFIGSDGIRAGWRLAIFLGICAALAGAIFAGFHLAHVKLPIPKKILYPSAVIGEGVMLAIALFAGFVMSRIERRPFASYGFPLPDGARGRIVRGFLFGFAMISAELLCLFALRGFRITGIATHGVDLLEAVLLWTVMFVLVGLSEEFRAAATDSSR